MMAMSGQVCDDDALALTLSSSVLLRVTLTLVMRVLAWLDAGSLQVEVGHKVEAWRECGTIELGFVERWSVWLQNFEMPRLVGWPGSRHLGSKKITTEVQTFDIQVIAVKNEFVVIVRSKCLNKRQR